MLSLSSSSKLLPPILHYHHSSSNQSVVVAKSNVFCCSIATKSDNVPKSGGGMYKKREPEIDSDVLIECRDVSMSCQIHIFPSSLSILKIEKTRSFTINMFHRRALWLSPLKSFQIRRRSNWRIAFALDTNSSLPPPGDDGQGQDRTGLGSTRLGRIAIALGKQLLIKINSARKNFPMKIFLLLLGFYTANALATILGQTGDWDVLVAGIVVAAIEGIGMLMYKKKPSSSGRLQSFVVFMNFWKAGVCLGLFVDAFKLGS